MRDEGIRHFQRGVALERVNRIGEAVEEYRQAIARYPHLREAHAALGFYYQRNGLLAKAADEFHSVANLEGDFLSYFNLGHVLVALERYEESLDTFMHCLRLMPDDPATHYEIAYVYFCCERYEAALKHLQIPLKTYPEDWEVLNLFGKCYMRMGRYEKALDVFGQALNVATTPDVEAALLDKITAVERHREFDSISNTKDKLYAQKGIVCLGSAQDNGLDIPDMQDYHFTYPDIGITLQRFLALQQANNWHFSAIVSVDRLSYPLAQTLATLLHIPVRQVHELQTNDTALVVIGIAREVELLLLTLERACCKTTTLCLGLSWTRHSTFFPDIVGVVAHGTCSVPWEPELRRLCADGAEHCHVDSCAQGASDQIVAAVQETPLDMNLASQVRYYTRKHRRLNFVVPTLPTQEHLPTYQSPRV